MKNDGLNIAVCVIAKNENHYIREFVEHYKRIGFDNILLYDNNDLNGELFNDVIDDYILSDYVKVIDYRGRIRCQYNAYNECYETYKSYYDWIAFFDVDEFLMIKNYDNIKSLFSSGIYDNFDAIRINDICYDDNDLVYVIDDDYSLVKRFTRECKNEAYHYPIKSIIRTTVESVKYKSSVHYVPSIKIACDADGNVCKNISHKNDHITKNTLWLNHYRYKTAVEYIQKKNRGYCDRNFDKVNNMLTIDSFFTVNEYTDEKYNILKDGL